MPEDESDELLAKATAFAVETWSARTELADGSVTWLQSASGGTMRSLGPYLYEGTVGIALFFAALAQRSGSDRWCQRSLQVIRPARSKFLAITPERMEALPGLGLGGHLGFGSILWSFTQLARLLDEPDLAQEADRLATLVTPTKVAQDRIYDVLLGSAGAILALLAVDNGRGGDALDRARECAQHLLANRVEVDGLRTWRTIEPFGPLVGFTHGPSGIALALLRLYQRLGDAELKDAALEGLEFERRAYSPTHGDWRDLREPDSENITTTWCYGCPGIALARLAALGQLETPEIRRDAELALAALRALPLAPRDDLCCGAAGHALVWLKADSLDGSGRRGVGLQVLRDLLQRQAKDGGPKLQYSAHDGRGHSLFTGTSGIGYALAQASSDEPLPSVLLLD